MLTSPLAGVVTVSDRYFLSNDKITHLASSAILLSNTGLQVDRHPYREKQVNVAAQALQLGIAEKILILGCTALTSSRDPNRSSSRDSSMVTYQKNLLSLLISP